MLQLDLEPLEEMEVLVQDEPALEIAMPQVFERPELAALQRGRLANVEALVAAIGQRHRADPTTPLGRDFQELVQEFQPLFIWAIACWDYLLSTQGCRFVPRNGEQKFGARGDYRAFGDKDYSRLVHGLFRTCVLEFHQHPVAPSLGCWLREHFWPLIMEAYRRLEQPPDPCQRTLTPYSYLRCVPYQFLNDYHHDLVYSTIQQRLSNRERLAVDFYFLRFHTEQAAANTMSCSIEECLERLRQGLVKLLLNDRLVYCLLRQIERY